MKKHTWEIFLGVLFTQLIVLALGLYMLREPDRLPEAREEILSTQIDEAMTLYAENCAVCHGAQGEGLGAAPPLDNPGLSGMAYEELFKVIARGRYATSMPAWSKEDGGPLSDYQISELTALIQYGNWQAVGQRVAELGLMPLEPFTAEPDAALLEAVSALPGGEVLAQGVALYAEYCVACHGGDGLGTAIAPPLNTPDVRTRDGAELSRILNYGVAGTLMASWSGQLTEGEIAALVTLMQRWDEVPSGAIPQPDEPLPVTEESLAQGEALFSANCSRCHGPEGQGTPRAPALNVKGFLESTSDQAMLAIIANGVPGTAMPAWGDRMTETELQALAGFIRQWEPTAPEVAVPVRPGGGGPPWLQNTVNPTPTPVEPGLPPETPPLVPTATGAVTDEGSAVQPASPTQGAASGGYGGPHFAPTPTPVTAADSALPDWRVLGLFTLALTLAFTLISFGYGRLKG